MKQGRNREKEVDELDDKKSRKKRRNERNRDKANIEERHEELMQKYQSLKTSNLAEQPLSDQDILGQYHQFLRNDDEDAALAKEDWKIRMSIRYYQKLFKEYALADLSRYEEGKIGLRWRTEREVVIGKGQFTCGNKRCDSKRDLNSYEILFSYKENGQKKQHLVKVRVCEECAVKLFYNKIQEIRKNKKKEFMKMNKKSAEKSSNHDAHDHAELDDQTILRTLMMKNQQHLTDELEELCP